MRKLVSALTILLMLMSGTLGALNVVTGGDGDSGISSASVGSPNPLYVSHAPIRINSDSDFDASHGVTNGSGTEADPYIIENYDINGTGYGYCIYIGNTTANFVLRNCYLHEASGGSGWPNDNGLILYNLQNGTVKNIIATWNRCGIYLYSSNNNTVSNSNASNNYYGIYLYSSNNNTISNNIGNSNNNCSIDLDYSNSNNLCNNTAKYNNQNGIYLSSSSSNIISSNTASNNYDGIYLDHSSNNTIANNTAENTNEGIHLSSFSDGNIIANNIASKNHYYGIHLYLSSNNTIANNNASNTWYGIYLISYSSNNRITNNNASNNEYGIRLYYYSSSNIISNNNALNTRYGIYLSNYSINNRITNNNASNNEYGIRLEDSINNTISNNTANSNNYYGIDLGSSSSNTIANNTASSNNEDGIRLYYSSNNTISNNTASNNYYGILLVDSINNTISNNTMVGDGILISGGDLSLWNTHTIDTSNTVNGKPVYYWKDRTGGTVPSGVGEIILANCTDVVVESQNLSDGSLGMELGFSDNNIISNNTATSNNNYGIYLSHSSNNTIANNTAHSNKNYGIYLSHSSNNTIANNTASNNYYGILLYYYSNDNRIYHNNFINNTHQAYDNTGDNYWNATYPAGGNYWSDYSGSDDYSGPNQDQPGSDVIGDTPYKNIDGGAGAQDNYPFMNPFSSNILTAHAPIRINSNADFDAAHGVTSGNGTKDNPYIIENYDINGTGQGYCIYVGNTTDYFVIRNCSLHDASGNYNAYFENTGLYLYNTTGATLDNNTANSNNNCGIYLDCSSNNTLFNNTASSNGYGIDLYSSSNNTVTNNNASNNNCGIELFGFNCNSNIIMQNNILNNNWSGICNWGWGDPNILNQITYNNVLSNGGRGIYMDSGAQYNHIHHNNIADNSGGNAYDYTGLNYWDDGYPSGGNYWGDYSGNDFYSGPDQNISGFDGIGDTPYDNIQTGNSSTIVEDHYPLINPVVAGPQPANDTEIPQHSNEFPPINSIISNPTPTISTWIFDNSWLNLSTVKLYVNGYSVKTVKTLKSDGQKPYFNISYTHESGFNDGDVVVCRIVADDIHGNSMEYTWQFTVDLEAPYIVSVYPAPNAVDVPRDTNITVEFSEPMDHASAEAGFSISPFVSGNFTWDGNNMTYHPNEYLAANTTYSVFIDSDAKDVAGNALTPYNWTFTIVQSSIVIHHSPVTSAELGSSIQIECQVETFWGASATNCTLYYKNVGDSNFTAMPMSLVSGDTQYGNWSATIPAQYFTGTVSYYIRAWDNTSESATHPETDASTNPHQINIVDTTAPTHSEEQPSDNTTVTESVIEVSVNITDLSAINTNTIEFIINGFSVDYTLTHISGGYHVSYLQDQGFDDGPVNCTIIAEDVWGNRLDWTWTFTVETVDTTPPRHSNESPPINGQSQNLTPVISVDVTDRSGVNASTIKFYINGFLISETLTPITDGYNVSYWHESGFSEGEVVTCRIVADDIYGNTLDFTWNFTAKVLDSFDIPVHLGWNLISYPLLASGDIEAVLNDTNVVWDNAQWYNPTDTGDHWKTHVIGRSSNDLNSIDNTMGIWLHVTDAGDGNITVIGNAPDSTAIQLHAGWNLVSYPSSSSTSMSNASLPAEVTKIAQYDSNATYLVSEVADWSANSFIPGQGYWVYATADTIWTTGQGPVISVVKHVSLINACPGDYLNYTIYYNNTGHTSAGDVWINDTLPTGVTFVSATAGYVTSGLTYSWHFTSVEPGSHSLTIDVTINATTLPGTVLTNYVHLNYNTMGGINMPGSEDTATTVVDTPVITVEKVVDISEATLGSVLTYTVYYNNTGTARANDVWINDTLPFGVTFGTSSAEANRTGTSWHFEKVTVGGHSFAFTVTVDNATLVDNSYLINRVFLNYTDQQNNSLDESNASATTHFTRPDITVSKIVDRSTAAPNDTLVYTIYYNNTGAGSTGDLWVNETFSPDVTFVTSSEESARTGTSWHFTSVSPGPHSFTVTVTVNSGVLNGTVIINTVNLEYETSEGFALASSSDSATTRVLAAKVTQENIADRNLIGFRE